MAKRKKISKLNSILAIDNKVTQLSKVLKSTTTQMVMEEIMISYNTYLIQVRYRAS